MSKFAIVTGGSRGLGKAVFNSLKSNGFECYEISRSGIDSYSIKCDLRDVKSSHQAFKDLLSKVSLKNLDEIVFVNNAGVLGPILKVGMFDPDHIINNINVNLISSFTLISDFMKNFRDSDCKKTIVNISSGAAVKGYAGWSLYCASKAGLENFIRSVATQEKAEKNPFTAINYNPSVMDTKMQEEIRKCNRENFPEKERFLDLNEKGLLRKPEDVAEHLISLIEQNPVSGNTYSIMD